MENRVPLEFQRQNEQSPRCDTACAAVAAAEGAVYLSGATACLTARAPAWRLSFPAETQLHVRQTARPVPADPPSLAGPRRWDRRSAATLCAARRERRSRMDRRPC